MEHGALQRQFYFTRKTYLVAGTQSSDMHVLKYGYLLIRSTSTRSSITPRVCWMNLSICTETSKRRSLSGQRDNRRRWSPTIRRFDLISSSVSYTPINLHAIQLKVIRKLPSGCWTFTCTASALPNWICASFRNGFHRRIRLEQKKKSCAQTLKW